MTAETPQQCPVCHEEYQGREQHEKQATIDCPSHSRICVQRWAGKLDVYRHDKITIELVQPQEPDSR